MFWHYRSVRIPKNIRAIIFIKKYNYQYSTVFLLSSFFPQVWAFFFFNYLKFCFMRVKRTTTLLNSKVNKQQKADWSWRQRSRSSKLTRWNFASTFESPSDNSKDCSVNWPRWWTFQCVGCDIIDHQTSVWLVSGSRICFFTTKKFNTRVEKYVTFSLSKHLLPVISLDIKSPPQKSLPCKLVCGASGCLDMKKSLGVKKLCTTLETHENLDGWESTRSCAKSAVCSCSWCCCGFH